MSRRLPGGTEPGRFAVTPGLVVTEWNATMTRWTGIAAEDAIGSDLREHFPQFRRSQLQLRLAGVFGGGPPVVLSAGIHGNLVTGAPTDRVPCVQHTTVVPVPAADGSGGTWAQFSVDAVSEVPGPAGRVLLVEDDRVNRIVAERQLLTLGWTVDVATNGADAVAAITANPGRYDAVLMDCHMPVMDGFAATRAVREAEAGGRTRARIFAMTASDIEDDRRLCIEAGMDGFVPKPVGRDELAQLLTD